MNKFATIFFIFFCFISFSQEERKVIDNFHFDVSLGYGKHTNQNYESISNIPPYTSKYINQYSHYFSLPKLELNYRNRYFKTGLSLKYNIFTRINIPFETNFGSTENTSGELDRSLILDLLTSVNLFSIFKSIDSYNLYIGPLLGYSKTASFHGISSSFLIGGEFYYKFFHLGFIHYRYLDSINQDNYPSKKDRAWFIDFGLSLNTGMFRKK